MSINAQTLPKRVSYGLWLLIIAYLGIAGASLIYGETTPWNLIWQEALLKLKFQSSAWNPLLDLRLPRLLILSCTGASLAVAGCVMQALFRNPLASPSVLGVSAGASLSITLMFACGLHSFSSFTLPCAAISGALMSLFLVQIFSRAQTAHGLILAGMAISTLLIAGQDLLLYALRYKWELLQTLTEWQNGFSGNLNWQHVLMQFPLSSLGLWGCWRYRREIDLFSLGEEQALALGVDIPRIRWKLFVCVALLTGSSIAVLGVLPFLGLILPNVIRQIPICLAHALIPWCIVAGGFLLVAMDYLLRSFAFTEITLGNITALLGGAFFLLLLLKPTGERSPC